MTMLSSEYCFDKRSLSHVITLIGKYTNYNIYLYSNNIISRTITREWYKVRHVLTHMRFEAASWSIVWIRDVWTVTVRKATKLLVYAMDITSPTIHQVAIHWCIHSRVNWCGTLCLVTPLTICTNWKIYSYYWKISQNMLLLNQSPNN